MIHKTRWTAQKIGRRLSLIEPLVYRKKHPIPPFQYTVLASPETEPPVGADVDDQDWETIAPDSYWGGWLTNFVMRTTFTIPDDWTATAPTALFLPIVEARNFSQPEVFAYIDGTAFAACDRHHQ